MRVSLLLLLCACTGGLSPVGPDTDDDTVADGTEADTTDPDTSDPDTDPDPTCEDDRDEPDDTAEQARELTLPAAEDGTACPGDPDTFAFPTRRRCVVDVDLSYDPAEGALDLLYLEGGAAVDGSFGGTGAESYSFAAEADGTYVVQVESRARVPIEYDLAIVEDCALACQDDANEPDDVREDATLLLPDLINSGTACEGDPDWFRVQASQGCLVDYTATPGFGGQIEAAMYSAAYEITTGVDPGTGGQRVRGLVASGFTYIEVTSATDSSYALAGEVSCAGSAGICPLDDAYEPNDTQQQAMPAVWGTRFGGAVCNDADWFRLPAAPGCTATIDLTFRHSNGDLDMWLYGGGGGELASAESGTDNERISVVLPQGPVLLEVRGFQTTDARNGYVLAAAVTCP